MDNDILIFEEIHNRLQEIGEKEIATIAEGKYAIDNISFCGVDYNNKYVELFLEWKEYEKNATVSTYHRVKFEDI